MNSDSLVIAKPEDNDTNEDLLLFAEEELSVNKDTKQLHQPWRILIVDDEVEIHKVTRLTLTDVIFANRPVELLSAYSGSEAITLLAEEKDIAIVLLDVVMETKQAGLDSVKKIREQLNNAMIRIILRTGQPGDAPCSEVIINYDINDYKEKSELTYDKLKTCVISALRTYQQLWLIEKCRHNLEKVILATAQYCKWPDKKTFAQQLLTQINSILNFGSHSLFLVAETSDLNKKEQSYKVLAGKGDFSSISTNTLALATNLQHQEIHTLITHTLSLKASQSSDNYSVYFFESQVMGNHAILLQKQHSPLEDDIKLLELFINNTLSAFNNMMTYSQFDGK